MLPNRWAPRSSDAASPYVGAVAPARTEEHCDAHEQVKWELCKNCVRWARNRRRTPTLTASHGRTVSGGKWLMEMRERVFWYHSVSVAGFAFQACSIDHSDISPFRIKHLRVVWNSVAQNPPSNRCDSISDLRSVSCERARTNRSRKLCQTSNVFESLTALALLQS